MITEILELIKSRTDNEVVYNSFKTHSEKCSTLNETLDKVLISNQNSEHISEIVGITANIREYFDDEKLNKNFNEIKIDGIIVDSEHVDINEIDRIKKEWGWNTSRCVFDNYLIHKTFRNADFGKIVLSKFFSPDIDKEDRKQMIDAVMNYIKDNNQFSNTKFDINPFYEKEEVQFHKGEMIVKLNKIISDLDDRFKEIDIGSDTSKKIINDFCKHFDLVDFLDFITAGRMGGDTKKCYMHFSAPSNFGKSFLFDGVFNKIGINCVMKESEIKAAYKGSPSGLSINSLVHSWFIFVDEFKSAVSEIKDMSADIKLTPKFKSQVTIPLYSKIFASAEHVRSLVIDERFVERQFLNRFIFWQEKTGNLDQREVYRKNKILYFDTIVAFTHDYLSRKINEYLTECTDLYCSSKKANIFIDDFIERRNKRLLPLEDYLYEKIEEFKSNFVIDKVGLGVLFRDYYFKHEGNIYISNKDRFCDLYLDKTFSDSEKKIIRHKTSSEILALIDNERRVFKINGKTKAGYLWIEKELSSIDICEIKQYKPRMTKKNNVSQLVGFLKTQT